ncbi:MAG TPA: pyridoxamine 5'-phosphate oxidase [Mycobacteriales bacterium]|nr:pyridoxamine 5'-phosphate oxidase [Mycobacteriales bacterium]
MPELSSLTSVRRSYGRGSLSEEGLAADWVTQFTRWFAEASASDLVLEPNAMVVATAAPSGQPSVRTVLLRGFDADGLVFFTNYDSRKGRELTANPQVALVFSWVPLERQVIVTGTAARVSAAESAAYFHSRPRDSQVASASSAQSSVVASRAVLESAAAALAERYPDEVPAPANWGGFRVTPDSVEFWQGRPARLHDRLRFRLAAPPADWVVERLSP